MSELKTKITERLKKLQLANLATITADGSLWTPPAMEPEVLEIG